MIVDPSQNPVGVPEVVTELAARRTGRPQRGFDESGSWIVTAGLPGRMAVDDAGRTDPRDWHPDVQHRFEGVEQAICFLDDVPPVDRNLTD